MIDMFSKNMSPESPSTFGSPTNKVMFPGSFYLVDGANIFFNHNAEPTPERIEKSRIKVYSHIRRAIKNQEIAGHPTQRMPVLVVLKTRSLPKDPLSYSLYLDRLRHLVEITPAGMPNVHIIGVDIKPCADYTDVDCLRTAKEKLGSQNKCQYYQAPPGGGVADEDKVPARKFLEGRTFKQQTEMDEPFDHLHCEFDDVVLSCIYWLGMNANMRQRVELVSGDELLIKSPLVCQQILTEISEMKMDNPDVQAGPNDSETVNFISDYYTMKVVPSTRVERNQFMMMDNASPPVAAGEVDAIRRTWGVRPGPPDDGPPEGVTPAGMWSTSLQHGVLPPA